MGIPVGSTGCTYLGGSAWGLLVGSSSERELSLLPCFPSSSWTRKKSPSRRLWGSAHRQKEPGR